MTNAMRLASTLTIITLGCGPVATDRDEPQGEDTAADDPETPSDGSSSDGSSSDGSNSETGTNSCPPLPSTLTAQASSACGDMSFLGLVDDLDAVVIVRAPPMVGMPWNVEHTVDAVYELPDDLLDVRVLIDAGEMLECDPEAEYPDAQRTLVPVSGTLEISLIDIEETGCFFTCANGHALFRDAQFVDAACEADAPTVTLDLVELWGDIDVED